MCVVGENKKKVTLIFLNLSPKKEGEGEEITEFINILRFDW